MLSFAGRVAFAGYDGRASLCWVQEFRDDDRPTVCIATEIPSNPGTGIAAIPERLAMAFCGSRNIDVETLLWIEHHLGTPESYQAPRSCRVFDRERFVRVDFATTPDPATGTPILHTPVRYPLDPAGVRRLVRGYFAWPPERAALVSATSWATSDSPL